MKIDTFIAEIKAENASYNAAGLIDEASIYKWVTDALKPFGANIMELHETVVEVKNGKAILPSNFYTLYVAYKCSAKGYSVKDPKHVDTLQKSYMWTERVERGYKWNSCEPCCKEEVEKTIVEKYYFRDTEVDFYYDKPMLLRLGKSMNRDKCHSKCRNMVVRDCPYEVIINGFTLLTNFEEGDIYLQYYGLPQDEEGKPIIPDVGIGALEEYVETYVYRKLYEKILRNKDDENVITLFQYYIQKEEQVRARALTDTKFSKLTPKSFNRIKRINRNEMLKYESMFPIV